MRSVVLVSIDPVVLALASIPMRIRTSVSTEVDATNHINNPTRATLLPKLPKKNGHS
jgi:hypothetical protein